MKKLGALIAILALFAVSTFYAQPALTVHVTGGYSLPMPDLKGTWPDDFTALKNPQPLYMKSGFNVGADAKYYVDKKLRSFGITLSLAYMGFTSGDLPAAAIDSLHTQGAFKTALNSFTAGLGVEYKFLTKKKASPFVGAEFTANFLSGKITPSSGNEFTLKSTSRFGLAFNLGVDIKLSKNIGIIVGGKYALMNLIGKDTVTSSTPLTEYTLRDKSYTTAGGVSVNALNLSYLQFYGGISFYLMQPKVKVKK